MEIWKDIKGYEGLYQVSNMGRIKSLNYRNTGKEGLLSGKPNSGGYLIVGLSKNKKTKSFYIHKLVAENFLPNPKKLPEVNHIDENKENNTVYNLEWCDRKYNNTYGTRLKRFSKTITGNKNPNAKKIKCINTNEVFNTMKEACEKYNIHISNISRCCRGKQKSAGKHPITKEKLVWQYIE